MVTIYDLLEVSEDASKEEIEKSYQNMVIEYQTNPILTEEENKKNELILNKLKMAYDILMNEEKRIKYDKELSKKRAEELIKNIPERKNNEDNTISNDLEENSTLNNTTNKIDNNSSNVNLSSGNSEEKNDNTDYDEIPKVRNKRGRVSLQDEETLLSKEEQKKIKKAAQKEFNENLKKVQQAEEEYNNAYNEAYRKYMKKMGYETKEPLIKKIRNTLILIIVIILVCLIAWIIPPVRKILINTYESNIIIKSLVDIIGAILKGIANLFE